MGKDTERLLNATRHTTAGVGDVDNPLDFIAEDHMREREVCALIDKLVSAAALQDADIHHMLVFLEDQLPQHLADEEIDLFPMMWARFDPEDEIERVIRKLHADHGHALADAPAIVAMIQSTTATSPACPIRNARRWPRLRITHDGILFLKMRSSFPSRGHG